MWLWHFDFIKNSNNLSGTRTIQVDFHAEHNYTTTCSDGSIKLLLLNVSLYNSYIPGINGWKCGCGNLSFCLIRHVSVLFYWQAFRMVIKIFYISSTRQHSHPQQIQIHAYVYHSLLIYFCAAVLRQICVDI